MDGMKCFVIIGHVFFPFYRKMVVNVSEPCFNSFLRLDDFSAGRMRRVTGSVLYWDVLQIWLTGT